MQTFTIEKRKWTLYFQGKPMVGAEKEYQGKYFSKRNKQETCGSSWQSMLLSRKPCEFTMHKERYLYHLKMLRVDLEQWMTTLDSLQVYSDEAGNIALCARDINKSTRAQEEDQLLSYYLKPHEILLVYNCDIHSVLVIHLVISLFEDIQKNLINALFENLFAKRSFHKYLPTLSLCKTLSEWSTEYRIRLAGILLGRLEMEIEDGTLFIKCVLLPFKVFRL
jgi:hypothetical protein